MRGLQFGLRLIHDQEVLTCGNLHSYERSVRTVCKDKRTAPASGHACNQLACVNVELERANEYKNDLLAEVAHELRNPIQPIKALPLANGSIGRHNMPHD